jgi:hypothetical protein
VGRLRADSHRFVVTDKFTDRSMRKRQNQREPTVALSFLVRPGRRPARSRAEERGFSLIWPRCFSLIWPFLRPLVNRHRDVPATGHEYETVPATEGKRRRATAPLRIADYACVSPRWRSRPLRIMCAVDEGSSHSRHRLAVNVQTFVTLCGMSPHMMSREGQTCLFTSGSRVLRHTGTAAGARCRPSVAGVQLSALRRAKRWMVRSTMPSGLRVLSTWPVAPL